MANTTIQTASAPAETGGAVSEGGAATRRFSR